MTRKRSAEDSGDASHLSVQSPQKRTKASFQSFPRTPAVASGSSSSSWTSSSPTHAKATAAEPTATPRTPYTPYPLHPSDSPSNPFGRKRTARLINSLPPTSSFRKHIPLRFQFVRTGKDKESVMSPRQGGVHRIVRVPLNYTFVHLRCLIAWLFNTPAAYASAGAGTASLVGTGEGYLFEVKGKSSVYSPLYKPGQIKSGVTTVKLSNVRDPARRWAAKCGFGFGSEEEDELSEDEDMESQKVEEEESGDWKWADEEDFTLGHAYPQGLDADIAIIYHHSPTTQIHITVNKLLLPRQRGVSNAPYVFTARGRVHLSPAPLPRLVFATSTNILQSLSSSSPVRPSPPPPRVTRARASAAAPSVSMSVSFRPESDSKVKAKGKDKGKGKAVVRLRSPTPPNRVQGYPRKLIPRRNPTPKPKPALTKLRSPPPPPRIDDDEDVELTDADADGDTDLEHQDQEQKRERDPDSDGLHPFDATHPFFHAQGSSPIKPLRDLDSDEDEDGNDREIVLVADSDDEQHREPSEPSSDEEDPNHEEEPHKTLNPDKWNIPTYAFARYLLEYMDPQGVALAMARGEVNFDEAFFSGLAQGGEVKGVDPFEDDDDDDVEEEKKEKSDGKKERRKKEKGQKQNATHEDEDEDEDMEEVPLEEGEDQSTDNEEDEDDCDTDDTDDKPVRRNAEGQGNLKRKRRVLWTTEERERESKRRIARFSEQMEAYEMLGDGDDDNQDEEQSDQEDISQNHTQGSTPGLTTDASSRRASSYSLPPSSPPRASSPSFEPLFASEPSSFEIETSSSTYPYSNRAFASSTSSLPDPSDFSTIVSAHYPNKKYTQTPAPPRARTKRLRIERLERRLELVKRGSYLTKYDEVDHGGEGVKETEVDELAGDDEQEVEVKVAKWTKPVLKPGEVWDPFGDEEEV